MTAKIGTIGWTDMKIQSAGELRDFDAEVVGWDVEESASACTANGGKVLIEPRPLAGGDSASSKIPAARQPRFTSPESA